LVATFTIGSTFLHYKNKQKQTAPENITALEKKDDDGQGENLAVVTTTETPSFASTVAAAEEINGGITSTNEDITNNDTGIQSEDREKNLKNEETSSEDWPLRRLLFIYVIVILIGMVAGMVGLGGGVLIAPLMMELGVHPQSAAATSTLVVLFSSTIASVTFGLYGRINLSYFAVYGPVCFVGGLVGVFVLSGLVRRYNMASLITLLLGVLVVVSAGLVAGFAMREAIEGVVDSGTVEAASQFCSG
jgi:hypothetical protein